MEPELEPEFKPQTGGGRDKRCGDEEIGDRFAGRNGSGSLSTAAGDCDRSWGRDRTLERFDFESRAPERFDFDMLTNDMILFLQLLPQLNCFHHLNVQLVIQLSNITLRE